MINLSPDILLRLKNWSDGKNENRQVDAINAIVFFLIYSIYLVSSTKK